MTARGQLARTGQSDEKGSRGRESEGRGSGGGSYKEMKEREGAGSSDNLRVSSYRSPRGLTSPSWKLPRQLINVEQRGTRAAESTGWTKRRVPRARCTCDEKKRMEEVIGEVRGEERSVNNG